MYRIVILVLLCIEASTNGNHTETRVNLDDPNQNWGLFVENETDTNQNWGHVDNASNETDPAQHRGNIKYTADESTMETTTEPMEMTTLPSFCLPYKGTVPDFRKPGRRLSEVKCQEYIWKMNSRVTQNYDKTQCYFYKLYKDNNSLPRPTIGGHHTRPGDYPHMGAIGWKSSAPNGTWVFKCGSSLISEKFVLTAAHCTKASPNDASIADPVPRIVRLGDKNIIDKYYFVEPTDAKISNIIVHPSYSAPKKYYDIALMELEKEVEFSRLLQPACLWDSFDTKPLKYATVTGWGIVETGSLDISPELNAASVDVISSNTCDELLKHSCNRNWCGLREHQLCAGKLIGGVDACQVHLFPGDSGGPIQVKIPQNTTVQGQMHYVFGVISFGVGCARPKLPGVYTRVASFIDWIEDNVWRNQMK